MRQLSPDIPLIIEHLPSREAYRKAAAYIRDIENEAELI
jgi:hypothetical protein